MRMNKVKLILMAFFCLMLILGTILFFAMIRNIRGRNDLQADNVPVADKSEAAVVKVPVPEGMTFPSPEPSSELGEDGKMQEIGTPPDTIVIMSGTTDSLDSPENEPVREDGENFRAVKRDVSWTEAQSAAKRIQGHLVTVSSKEEMINVIKLCIEEGIDICWIGCHRENGQYVWENGESIDIDSLGYWGAGEPSFTDQGEPEDYIMLWYMNGRWCLNDSCDDPHAQFPRDYDGKMGYIVEFDK